jgi:hypothetical protein
MTMPRRRTSEQRPRASGSTNRIEGREHHVPAIVRSTEAVSVGLVNTLTATVVSAIRGLQEVGAEVGSTAVNAVRGTIRAAEEIGGDLGRLARNATAGAVAAGRDVGGEMGRAATGATDVVRRATSEAAHTLGIGGAAVSARKPLRKADGTTSRRGRRRQSAA